jgi:3-methylcrotonyl-CoA carboxylase alpha subunit
MKVTLRPSGSDRDPVEIELHGANDGSPGVFHVRTNGCEDDVRIETTGPSEGWIRLRNTVHRFFAVRKDDRVHVWLDGKTYDLEYVDSSPRRGSAAAASSSGGDLKAPMPGTILDIKVHAGDTFEPHDAIILMESMKMEMTLSVPHAGRVESIKCKVGELVDMGKVLAKLDSA